MSRGWAEPVVKLSGFSSRNPQCLYHYLKNFHHPFTVITDEMGVAKGVIHNNALEAISTGYSVLFHDSRTGV